MKRIVLTALTILMVPALYAHETIKTMTMSPDFGEIAGTPRVARDSTLGQWAVAWRQHGNPPKIMGRIVKSDGSLKPPKLLGSSVAAVEQDLDLAYGSVDRTYLLAFENAAGLQVQRLSKDLVRQGKPLLVEAGTTGANPRIVYDPTDNHFVLFWIGSEGGKERNALRSVVLNPTGAADAAQTLAQAAAGRMFGTPSASHNEETGNFAVLVSETTGTAARFLGFTAKPDGSLLRSAPIQFQGVTAGMSTIGDAAFAENGFGFATWMGRGTLKSRKISPTGGFASGTKNVANASDSGNVQASIVYDASHDEFVIVWTKSSGIYAAAIAEASGTVTDAPFQVAASTLGQSLHAVASTDPGSGHVLAVWEDGQTTSIQAIASANKYRVRAALFAKEAQGGVVDVSIEDNFFSPSTISVSPGTTVRWTLRGSNPHTVTSGTPSSSPGTLFESGTLTTGQTFQFQFTTAGTFQYFCRIHGGSMSGTVIVGGGPSPNQISIGDNSFSTGIDFGG